MSEHYWISSGSDRQGPYTLSQLQSMWRSGSITADMLYYQDSIDDWEPISLISDRLDTHQSPQTPPPILPIHQTPSQIQPTQTSAPYRPPSEPLKNPGVAAVLSFVIPGLGQIYNG